MAPFTSYATAATVWLVMRQGGSSENTVAVCESLAAAHARAIEMASYQRLIGRPSRVYERADAAHDWCLIWPLDDAEGEEKKTAASGS